MKSKLSIQTYTPKVLHPYIEAFKVYHFHGNEDIRLFPKGVFEIVFQRRHSFQHHTNYSEGWKLRPRNFIGGLHNQYYHVTSGDEENYCIVAEFKPNTAKYFIPEKLGVFQNSLIDINDIWGNAARKLSNKIDRESSDAIKIKHIENFLLDQFIPPKESVIDTALDTMISSKGFIDITTLSKTAFLSKAQFRKRFKEEVGIAPSQYHKIVRVNASLKMIQQKEKSLTDISYALGYFDQSHFIKDFKAVIGWAPARYQALNR